MVYITAVKNACFNSKTNIYLKKYNIVCRIIQIILHEIIEEKENTGNFSGRIFFFDKFLDLNNLKKYSPLKYKLFLFLLHSITNVIMVLKKHFFP